MIEKRIKFKLVNSMRMKKGFTLIELLAVIIILAIIALIATPIILNVIEDARKSTGKSEASMILSGINNYCATSAMKNQLDGSIDICNDTDGVTIDDVSKMVSLGNAEVLEVEYQNGKVTKLKIKSNNYEFELQPDGSFTVNGEGTDPVDPTPEVPEPVSFANDSWETIANAVKEGNTSAYNVGDTKEVTLTGEYAGTYTVRIANISTPTECSGSDFSQTACGFVIEFVDIITNHNMNSSNINDGGYPASEMYNFVNNDIYNLLPDSLKSIIVDTKVVSSRGTAGSSNFTTTDRLYLLSTEEILGSNLSCDASNDSTRQLDYYEDNGVTSSNYSGAIKNYNGSASYWWTRSASTCLSTSFYSVSTYGCSDYSYYGADNSYGVAPAFRIG